MPENSPCLRWLYPLGGLNWRSSYSCIDARSSFARSSNETWYKNKEVGINQMRFWDLYYGRKPITNEEYLSLCDYFGITLQEAFEARQLNIFNNDEL